MASVLSPDLAYSLCVLSKLLYLWEALSLSLSPYLKSGQYDLPHGVAMRIHWDHVALAFNIDPGVQEGHTEL